MDKVLILTSSTGEGHNQAANSLKDIFEEKGHHVLKIDFLKQNSRILSSFIINGYDFCASKFPKVYGLVYKICNIQPINKFSRILFFNIYKKLKSIINDFNPTIIVSTHPLAISLLGKLKSDGFDIPTAVIVTDFKAHYSYIDKNIDMYLTASNYTKDTLIEKGISKDKIFPYGIPVRNCFKESIPEIQLIRDVEFFNILLMGGSMGLNNISDVLKELLCNSNKLRITVVCGNNSRLKNDLLLKYKSVNKNKKLHILGFSKDIPSLMDYSDLIITKPGGLTVSEAINKNIPLIIPFSIPGQEVENTDFLVSNGYAFTVDNLLDLNPLIDSFRNEPEKLIKVRSNLKNLSQTYSNDKIYESIYNLIENNIHN